MGHSCGRIQPEGGQNLTTGFMLNQSGKFRIRLRLCGGPHRGGAGGLIGVGQVVRHQPLPKQFITRKHRPPRIECRTICEPALKCVGFTIRNAGVMAGQFRRPVLSCD